MHLTSRLVLSAIAVAAVIWALAVDAVGFGDAYPQDSLKRDALALCSAGGQNFVRFFEEDRNTCYTALHIPGYPSNLGR